MNKKILLIIVTVLIFLSSTGCGKKKSDAKYRKDEYTNDINILFKVPLDNKDYYDEYAGFKYVIEYSILDIDENNKLVDVYSTPPEFYVPNINKKHKYYRLYNKPVIIKINNKLYKKKTYEYNLTMLVQINEPKDFWNKKYTNNMNIEDFYNKRIKNIIDNYLNKAINKALVKKEDINAINIKELNDEFNKLISNEVKKNGLTINIQGIEFINK